MNRLQGTASSLVLAAALGAAACTAGRRAPANDTGGELGGVHLGRVGGPGRSRPARGRVWF
jgi:hypothetical protein